MQNVVAGLALQHQQDEGPLQLGSKRSRLDVPAAVGRIRVRRKFGVSMPEPQAVAERLLSDHACNQCPNREALVIVGWGRMKCAARSLLGMQRAKALIAICATEKAKIELAGV
jgi:hypothetical protein